MPNLHPGRRYIDYKFLVWILARKEGDKVPKGVFSLGQPHTRGWPL